MKKIDKPWGYEQIWAQTEDYIAKVIFIAPGHRLSKQYHENKEETVYVLEGTLVNYDEDDKQEWYSPGHTLHVEPRQVHRFSATENHHVVIMEVSTNHPTDVVRIEDDYGRSG